MSLRLVVTRPFAQYARGEVIDDAAKVTDILAGEYRLHVVRVIAAAPAPVAAAPTTKEG